VKVDATAVRGRPFHWLTIRLVMTLLAIVHEFASKTSRMPSHGLDDHWQIGPLDRFESTVQLLFLNAVSMAPPFVELCEPE
jgi:hypothetical protein